MTEAEERDLIDELIDALNDGVDQITFDRDVLDTNRPEDWAAVELSGQEDAEWADGQLIDQALSVDIWVCVSDRGSWPKRQVQAVLKAFCPPRLAGWRLVSRAYLYDLDKVMWRWTVSIDGPLAMDPEEEEEEDLDELPFTDPEEDPEDEDTWPEADSIG
jgi:hypothetical protein